MCTEPQHSVTVAIRLRRRWVALLSMGAIPALLPVTVQRQETAWPGLLSCKVPADFRQRSEL